MRVLIIEDDKEIANLERDYLNLAGISVDISNDGIDGFNLAQTGSYDLIVLDLMLPGMDGFEIAKHLRETTSIPILVVSAKTADIDKIRALGIGVDDYMEKPFSPNELVARVKAHILRLERIKKEFGDVSAPDGNRINASNLMLDLDTRQAFLAGKEIILTNKEFDLLLFMMKNSDRVISKDELLMHVWGIDAFVETATLTVHINKIRDKLENESGKKYIHTIWGIGYKFSCGD